MSTAISTASGLSEAEHDRHLRRALIASTVDTTVVRKAALITTLLLNGFATVAVGLVPTYTTIGIWGAVLPTFIRLVQGIGVGGEWGGSVLLAMEWSKGNHNRGMITS